MSFLSQYTVAKCRKRKRCALCHDLIKVGDSKVVRNGTDGGDFWTMHMHPECEAYETVSGTVDPDWYEDCFDPAFDRSVAIEYAKRKGAV
jgi:hypothetical protein